jgi:hypothetical protein
MQSADRLVFRQNANIWLAFEIAICNILGYAKSDDDSDSDRVPRSTPALSFIGSGDRAAPMAVAIARRVRIPRRWRELVDTLVLQPIGTTSLL